MISWIQSLMQKHYRWLFSILLVVIVVAFVFTIGSTPAGFGDGSRAKPKMFFGVNLNSPAETHPFGNAAQISAFTRGEHLTGSLEEETLRRIALLHLADILHVPYPDEAALAETIQGLPAFQTPEGTFSQDRWLRFLDDLSQSQQFSEQDLVRSIQQDFRIQLVNAALRGPGYQLPFESQLTTQHLQAKWQGAMASLDFASFTPEIALAEEEIAAHYKATAQKFRVPQQAQASYALFPLARYAAKMEDPGDEVLERYFQRNRNLFKDVETLSADRNNILESWRREESRKLAVRDANALNLALYNDKVAYGSEKFRELLAAQELELTAIPAYTQENPPTTTPLPQRTLARLFRSPHYFSDPIDVQGGIALLFLETLTEARIPPLEEISEAVAQDLLETRRRALFVQHGESLRTALSEQIAQGQEFAEAARSLGLESRSFADFSFGQPAGQLPIYAQEALLDLQEGRVSPMIVSGNQGHFVFLSSREQPQVDPDSQEASFQAMIGAFYHARLAEAAILETLVQEALKKSEL